MSDDKFRSDVTATMLGGDPQRPLALGDLKRFIDAKWNPGACECCGSQQWQFGDDYSAQIGTLTMPAPDGSYSIGRSRLAELYTLLCTNCGNVRLISRKFLDEWLAGHPRPTGS